MKTKLYALLLQALLPCLLFAQTENYSFNRVANMPSVSDAPASFNIGDSVYIVCGLTGNAGGAPKNMTHNVWLYNTLNNTWTQQSDFPGEALYGCSSFVINGMGYVVNGWDSTEYPTSNGSLLWQYNPQTDTWTNKATFPGSTRYTTASFAVNGKGYVAMGFKPINNTVWQYDPVADAWTQKNNFPGLARQAPVSFVVNNVAYAGLGAIDIPNGFYLPSDFYSYNDATDTWTQLGTFPGDPMTSYYTVVINNEAFVIAGQNQNSLDPLDVALTQDVWKYAPATDTWTFWGLLPDTAMGGGIGVSVNGQGYLGLGYYSDISYTLISKFWRFGPGIDSTSCNASVYSGYINNATRNFEAIGNFSASAIVSWNFGDGGTGNGTSVFHTYDSAGVYTVGLTVSDTANGGCSFNTSVADTIGGISTCSVSISSTNFDSTYTLWASPTGVAPYTYNWTTAGGYFISNSPDPLVNLPYGDTATYCLTIMDSTGCQASACQLFVGAPDTSAPTCQTYLYIYPDPNVPGLYYGYIYHTGATPITYVWSFGDGTLDSIPGDSIVNHTYNNFGFYDICLTITDAANCTSSYCDSVFYAYKTGGGPMNRFQVVTTPPSVTSGIANVKGQLLLSAYPNPANDKLTIVANQAIDYLAVYTTLGQMVKEQAAPQNNTIDIDQLASGIYYVDVHIGASSGRVKFVKVN
jgi:N-acetylneuraminic acid mutarotase